MAHVGSSVRKAFDGVTVLIYLTRSAVTSTPNRARLIAGCMSCFHGRRPLCVWTYSIPRSSPGTPLRDSSSAQVSEGLGRTQGTGSLVLCLMGRVLPCQPTE